ncbi:hypothetical protein [Mesorhizobium sp.]|uniref:hypothetical protein n=1 Tax=Mesorhizobium sp. TaxID=1871066 RepID=UPI000FE6F838|nr:hypothetical protein [Mesorhizobium sp.]RWF64106.1 MAG: hypothetical protein EOS47_16155 [Mesorhizobium sp.]TIT38741.1 MAG: hypothetical protein E5W76_21305 [Mesorhizobium sp.]
MARKAVLLLVKNRPCGEVAIKMFVRKLIFTIAIVATWAGPAFSDDCSDALIVSTYRKNSESSSDWRLSQYVSEDEFKQLQKNAGAKAVVYGVPVSGSYSDYQTASKNRIQQSGEKLTKAQAENVIWTGLNDASLRGYEACLHSKDYGLFLYPRKATKKQVELRLEYRPVGSAAAVNLNWPGAPAGADFPKQIKANERRTIIIRRPASPDDEILLSVNGGGATAEAITITAYPNPPKMVAPAYEVLQVSMRNPVTNVGTAGTASLHDGYEVRNIRYHHVGPGKDDHEMDFDVYGPEGRVKTDISYIANNGSDWKKRISSVQIESHVLKYAFSNWNDNQAQFHFIWQ